MDRARYLLVAWPFTCSPPDFLLSPQSCPHGLDRSSSMGAVFERSTHPSSTTDPDWTGSGDTL
jgi:hypothetical protein